MCLIAVCLLHLVAAQLGATPSTTYWTPCTMDFQAPDLTHITLDNYFTVGRNGPGSGGESFPTDVGLTWGRQLSDRLQFEFGFDVLEPSDHPLFFSAKVGFPEGKLSPRAPAVELGLFNVGTERGVTNHNVLHLIVGKSLPREAGRLHVSYYVGNGDVLRSSDGRKENTGFMVAYDRWLVTGKFMIAMDYASGDNAIGGGGIGLYTFFTPNIDLLVGPVWFNDEGLNGKMKWTTQIDMNF